MEKLSTKQRFIKVILDIIKVTLDIIITISLFLGKIFVLQTLINWFLIPIFSLQPIGFLTVMGVNLIFNLLRRLPPYKDFKEKSETMNEWILDLKNYLFKLLFYLFALGLGYLIINL
jgi:hypothetical protein